MKAGTHNYGAADRLLHRIAFRAPRMQRILADLEDSMFAKPLAEQPRNPPVFITSLARAGTTLVLELLTASGLFASYTYADMPFLLCPLLWDVLTRGNRGRAVSQERAHGDGVLIDQQASEAFDEVVWRTYWPRRSSSESLPIWTDIARAPQVRAVLERYMRKVLLLRRRANARASRYVSKNNSNLSRLRVLAHAFPESTVIVPFRNPAAHVASLLRQHRQFADLQGQDRFAAEYMRYLGHEEFGAILAPIDFPDRSAADRALDPAHAAYWYRYWCAAFRHVLAQRERVVLLDYDELCCHPARTLELLAGSLGLEPPAPLVASATRVRAPRQATPAEAGEGDPAPSETADLLARLRDGAVNRADRT